MKYFLTIIFSLSLISCGFQVGVDNLELSANSQIITTDTPSGTLVGNIEFEGVQCSSPDFTLEKNPSNYFNVNSDGSITLAVNNPSAGIYELVILGECDSSIERLSLEIHIIAVPVPIVPMVSIWRVGVAGFGDGDNSITLPLRSGFDYNFIADWGDGSMSEITSFNDTDITHVYSSTGDYTVTLTGTLEAWYFNFTGDRDKIIEVSELGSVGWRSFRRAFLGCNNLRDVKGGNTSQVTDMSGMFFITNLANPDTSNWNVSSVTDMSQMFQHADLANPSTSNWNVRSVIDMSQMFQNSGLANPDTSNWDTSSVTNMQSMFRDADSATPDTSSWDVSAVETMNGMFQGASLANPDTRNWDVGSVTDMTSMFRDTPFANPDTSNWDVNSVVSMREMFKGASVANPNTINWNVSSVVNMLEMFNGASVANPNTTNWDVGSVINMIGMFRDAPFANPDTSNWDVSSVVNMREMFNSASFANPDTSNWNVSSVTNMDNMFLGANSLSNSNYSNFLIMLNTTNPTGNLSVGSVPAAFQPAAAVARNNLINVNNWIINDEGAE